MANLKMINNLIALPDTSSLSMESSVNDLTTESGSFWVDAAMDCLCAISDRMNTVECYHMNFN